MKVLYNVSCNYNKLGCPFNQSKVFSAKVLYDVTKTGFYFMKNNLPHPHPPHTPILVSTHGLVKYA